MTFEQVETFLTIVKCGNISLAANLLFVSQSTISNRIQTLEEELSILLLNRKKGCRTVELTAHGKLFVPIAQQWISLWKDTQHIKSLEKIESLVIGSVDLVNTFTFVPFYQNYLKNFSNIKLKINTFHSSEIHSLVENRVIDIGYVFSQVRYMDIISKPIYRELMYLICDKDSKYYDNIHPKELDLNNEVFLNWGQDYQQWHDLYWNSHDYPAITVNTGSLIYNYLDVPNRWAIVPMSLVSSLKKLYNNIVYYKIQNPPPPRICYQLTHRYPKPSLIETINRFEDELLCFINSNTNICRFEPWMLEIELKR